MRCTFETIGQFNLLIPSTPSVYVRISRCTFECSAPLVENLIYREMVIISSSYYHIIPLKNNIHCNTHFILTNISAIAAGGRERVQQCWDVLRGYGRALANSTGVTKWLSCSLFWWNDVPRKGTLEVVWFCLQTTHCKHAVLRMRRGVIKDAAN